MDIHVYTVANTRGGSHLTTGETLARSFKEPNQGIERRHIGRGGEDSASYVNDCRVLMDSG
jgi:hypothetical protein